MPFIRLAIKAEGQRLVGIDACADAGSQSEPYPAHVARPRFNALAKGPTGSQETTSWVVTLRTTFMWLRQPDV